MPDNNNLAAEVDTKDWTWVLSEQCPDCGVAVGDWGLAEIGAGFSWAHDRFQDILDGAAVRERPSPHIWSPLEYTSHVRDVYRRTAIRLRTILAEDNPMFPDWDQSVTALTDRYDLDDPVFVGKELTLANEALQATLGTIGDHQLDRPGLRSNGSAFSTLTLAQYAVHDPIHHVWDVTGETMP